MGVYGLNGSAVTKSQASDKIMKVFKNATDVEYESETLGKFETYNFRVTNSDNEKLFVQVTKIGGYILTISGAGQTAENSIDYDGAKQIALNFVSDNGIEDAEVVWSDSIDSDVYFNVAPKQNGIILYPDLVKVKVNLANGTVVGYDATSYFSNHIERELESGSLTLSDAKGKVPSTFEIISSRVVLSPLDYNREVVCVEVEAEKDGETYYFYFNCQNGDLENVLKVIKTDNGQLLM
jgi:spore germination protein